MRERLDINRRVAPIELSGERRPSPVIPRAPRRRIGRWIVLFLLVLALLPVPVIVLYRFVPPPITPLMLLRAAESEPIRKRWIPYARIAPSLVRAVVASEDARFCRHHGFDWIEMDDAWSAYRAGEKLRGASTISMQTAKNLFLWPGRSFVRKGVEAYLTVLIEAFWSKERIIEVYLNIVEWGHGVYGAEAAAITHFGKPAAELTAREAVLLASVLPNPRAWPAERPTAYIEERATTILRRMPEVVVPEHQGCR